MWSCGPTMPPRASVGLGVVLLVLAAWTRVDAAQATFRVDVPAGKLKTVRVRNLPAGATLAVKVRTSGDVQVILLGQRASDRRPDVARPLFQGRTDTSMTFSVITPRAGDYYVILDNRTATESRAVEVSVGAARGKAPARPKGETDT